MIKFYTLFLIMLLFSSVKLIGQTYALNNELIFEDDFLNGLENWIIEQMPGGIVKINNGQMEINDEKGCTVWLNMKLKSPILIEYNVTLIDSGGFNDRVSDLNCFWMAVDPSNLDTFYKNSTNRQGKFANYHCLRLYYVGFGANNNTTTRFRRYPGDCSRPMLPEHDLIDNEFMNIPNVERKVQIISAENRIIYKIDNIEVFNFYDENPFLEGYFGLRTVKNHMKIDDFKVFKLK